ncbi:hypothetical protein B4N89_29985 [Embleya scabrispora]|uniref:Uncharacterized protein n=1 Tax=Embleya scabrispora TaxID=159449 RepID=A0A1T3P6G6_9ACTN|nr:hypothetical protein [Embleya scabrispora]OPC84592.1 hypothetical protein B4N89_29985 [Embleya scabrispora]
MGNERRSDLERQPDGEARPDIEQRPDAEGGHDHPEPPTGASTAAGPDADQAARAARWGHLPERVASADLVEEKPADPPNDPDFGRDPDRDWLLRYTP